jgi:hypothetical protein
MTLTLYQVADCETEGRDLTSLQVIMPAGGKISATAYEKAGGSGGFFTTNHIAGLPIGSSIFRSELSTSHKITFLNVLLICINSITKSTILIFG